MPGFDREKPAEGARQGYLVAGRYKLVEPLGRGAMGEVWLARDGVLRIDVALKFITLPRACHTIDPMERFRFEAQVAAQLGGRRR